MSVYILHLQSPLHHARHYVGYSKNGRTLAARIEHHEKGTAGCRFTQVLKERGIGFTVARVFKGKQFDRSFERHLKRTKNVKLYCPICNPNPRDYTPRTNVTDSQ